MSPRRMWAKRSSTGCWIGGERVKKRRRVTRRMAIAVADAIAGRIHDVRGCRVMLDVDLAALYGVTTGRLNEQVRRNPGRFPPDFAFHVTAEELDNLRSQTAISSRGRHGRRRTLPFAFTEQGVAMLSSVLRSQRAIAVNIEIMRAFVHAGDAGEQRRAGSPPGCAGTEIRRAVPGGVRCNSTVAPRAWRKSPSLDHVDGMPPAAILRISMEAGR
ncbi:MAG: ORF6N domain-containing protein [Gemmatimonadales bacterium]